MLKLYKNLNQNASHTESPEFTKAKKLDQEILDILHNKNLTEPEKALLYSQAAAQFKDLRGKAPETKEVLPETLSVPVQEVAQAEPPLAVQVAPANQVQLAEEPRPTAVDTAPPKQNRSTRARLILRQIKEKPHILREDISTGEVILNNRRLPNSDFAEILHNISSVKPNVQARNKPYITNILKALGKAGVSPFLIGNNLYRKTVLAASQSQEGRGGRHDKREKFQKWCKFL